MAAESTPTEAPLLQVTDLVKHFPVRSGVFRRVSAQVRAVDGVSFEVKERETLGLVGESGCGKTTLGRTVLRLINPTAGKIVFGGEDITRTGLRPLRRKRRDMQLIFQDPYSSLDPRLPIGQSIEEGLKVHGIGNEDERHERVREALHAVGLSPALGARYPHEFSGGQRQRIGIARALALRPRLIVCDEPVSALDVSIQSQVLNLLADLQEEFGLTYLFIAHDLGVVEHVSDRVAVMYLGKIVEITSSERLFANPRHPYTQALMSAIPVPNPETKAKRIILTGDVPSPINPPSGCRFHTRCPIAEDRCKVEEPLLRVIEPDHEVSCHLA